MNGPLKRTETRFEWSENGHTAYADYHLADNILTIPYVEAPPALRGTGAAGRLMSALTALANEEGWKIVPICGYARQWIERHPVTDLPDR